MSDGPLPVSSPSGPPNDAGTGHIHILLPFPLQVKGNSGVLEGNLCTQRDISRRRTRALRTRKWRSTDPQVDLRQGGGPTIGGEWLHGGATWRITFARRSGDHREIPPVGAILRSTASGASRAAWHVSAGHRGDPQPLREDEGALMARIAGIVSPAGRHASGTRKCKPETTRSSLFTAMKALLRNTGHQAVLAFLRVIAA